MIKPMGVFVAVEPIEVEEKTAGGIYIPDQVRERDQAAGQRGKIIGVGPACEYLDESAIGKTALFGRYAGVGAEFEQDGRKVRLIDNRDIKGLED